jgi:hypothetical protein
MVETGVWRGGSMMAVALTLLEAGDTTRPLYLYDTFAGMPEPGQHDVSLWDRPALAEWQREGGAPEDMSRCCHASLAEVKRAMGTTGYGGPLHFVAGKIEETIPDTAPATIALLRLDTDWYESTRHALEHLYPRLAPGGVLLVDDYGHWRGARKAVDEYLEQQAVRPLLVRVDYTARVAIKPVPPGGRADG